ncbi:Hypothetical_protein [Hexamita inflata]|uniref:Hypothetical_protein n=1 Tax=Hexamita inflata TaxID=28002 RepID=A0AA86QK41_9EUKA|nr:Hypothetical protein HINF_LOCUS48636 [Hexamita inflata]
MPTQQRPSRALTESLADQFHLIRQLSFQKLFLASQFLFARYFLWLAREVVPLYWHCLVFFNIIYIYIYIFILLQQYPLRSGWLNSYRLILLFQHQCIYIKKFVYRLRQIIILEFSGAQIVIGKHPNFERMQPQSLHSCYNMISYSQTIINFLKPPFLNQKRLSLNLQNIQTLSGNPQILISRSLNRVQKTVKIHLESKVQPSNYLQQLTFDNSGQQDNNFHLLFTIEKVYQVVILIQINWYFLLFFFNGVVQN